MSILKNEVYKTMIMLKESDENSSKDKESIKDSLSDISHQLKTPITSIMIALDNLEDNPDLDLDTRERFIKSAKRDINNIRFLIQSILKLSKFDTNAVEHADNYVSVNVEENNAYVKITIKNDGEQISKEDIPNIFKRFYKGKNATKDSIGIGLALAKTIIESEKGYISVESKKNLTEFTIKYSKI